MSSVVHDSAARGYQKGSGIYASARPSYHPAIVDHLVTELRARSLTGPTGPTRPTGLVVDLGAGTGISTKALLERGVDVVAVEPVAAMRVQLEQALPDTQVLDGRGDAIPLDDGSVAAVVAAQAFHWFNHGLTLDEISRVLQPDGILATLWNVRDESVPWQAEWTRIVDRFAGDTPRYRTMKWRRAIEQHPRFELADEWCAPNPQPSSPDAVIARAMSTSFIAALGSDDRASVESELRAAVAPLGDRFDFDYDTHVQIWARSHAASGMPRVG